MKRIITILLLSLLFFNWVGYRFLSAFLEYCSETALDERIERNDYTAGDLLEIRTPLYAPYTYGISSEYERYEGETTIDGVDYKFVKRKVENGCLVLLCLPNHASARVRNASSEFFKLVNDLTSGSHGKEKQGAASSLKIFQAEYKSENNDWGCTPFTVTSSHFHAIDNSLRFAGFPNNVLQPPRLLTT